MPRLAHADLMLRIIKNTREPHSEARLRAGAGQEHAWREGVLVEIEPG